MGYENLHHDSSHYQLGNHKASHCRNVFKWWLDTVTKFGNVNKKLFRALLIPGVLGARARGCCRSTATSIQRHRICYCGICSGIKNIFTALRRIKSRKKLLDGLPEQAALTLAAGLGTVSDQHVISKADHRGL
jgi:hypothetical protein